MDTKQSSMLLSANKKDSDELSTELDQQEYVPFYGVSYIGGDPCGSKYNNDPFDATSESSKPGLPDSMKDRIAALAAKKLLEKKEKEKDS